MEIPPRSESIHFISTEFKSDCIVCSEELQDGIYLASSAARPISGKIPIKILNTTEKMVTLSNLNPKIYDLRDYDVCTFNENENNSERVKKLFSMLNINKLNKLEFESIQNICVKYADVFYLPGDQLKTTDIYTHNISLKPNAKPVFSKPYRLPRSQKEEIKQQISNMLNCKVAIFIM